MKSSKSKIYKTRNKNLRKHYDILLIIVAIVGISGSVIVFNSYANRKIQTEKSGVYQFSSLLGQSGSSETNVTKLRSSSGKEIYGLNNKSEIRIPFNIPNRKFCFYGWNRSDTKLIITTGDSVNQPTVSFNDTKNDYPLTNAEPKLLTCYNTESIETLESELAIKSIGNTWLETISTE